MIRSIQLEDYKRFSRFKINAKQGNILVGPNNSGKSSILDALRLLEAGLKLTRRKPEPIYVSGRSVFGYKIPHANLPFSSDNVVRNYRDDHAKIKLVHENGNAAVFLIRPDEQAFFYVEVGSTTPRTKEAYRKAFPTDLLVVPTLGPLEQEEKVRKPETVDKNINTRIASRNFRNIWMYRPPADFEVFRSKIAEAWPKIKIDPPEYVRGRNPYLTMFYHEGRIPREIQWAGYGFQIWLQLQTHLARANSNSILVLDEPDIYLHPDLQHRLYHDVKHSFKQFFIATHATEIINEAPTSDLVAIEPEASTGKRVRTEEQYTGLLDYIGSAQNADFAKISRARKVIFVEGQDAKLMRSFARRYKLHKLANSSRTPIQELGGFGRFERATSTVWAFKQLLDVTIEVLCLFDRDYRSSGEIEFFKGKMADDGLDATILQRKEIENYLLDPLAMAKAINKRLKAREKDESASEALIKELIDSVLLELKTDTSANLLAEYIRHHSVHNKSIDASTHIKAAQEKFETKWETFDGRRSVGPGKETFKKVSRLIREEFGVSITANMVVNELELGASNDLLEFLRKADQFME